MKTLKNGSVTYLKNRVNPSRESFPRRYAGPFYIPLMLLLVLLMITSALVGCGSDDPTNQPLTRPGATDTVTPQTPPTEPTVSDVPKVDVTIGNLSDLTGVSANAMGYINKALADFVEHYNENNLIPGVNLKVVTYDGQMDPSKDVPGYNYLRERGADLIFTPIPATPTTLRSRVDKDGVPLFGAASAIEVLTPPGYVFNLGSIPEYDAYTLMAWIAENHWDYEVNGPAKIGAAAWSEGYSDALFKGVREYVEAHPEQFELVGLHLIDFTFQWGTQIEDLKDCDYIWGPLPMHVFIKDYRDAGYHTVFLATDAHAGFMGMIDKGGLWEEIDGMLFVRGSKWWTEEQGGLIELTKELVYKNHDSDAEEIIRSGVGYLSSSCIFQTLNIIKKAAEDVGPENVDSQAIYEAATSYNEIIDGIDRYSCDETSRSSNNYYLVYEADGELQDLYNISNEWLPTLNSP